MALRAYRLALLTLAASTAVAAVGVAQDLPSTDIYLARLTTRDGRVHVEVPLNITDRDGYDNQPLFDASGRGIFYTSYRRGQADVYWYAIAGGQVSQITHTPESEYSPTVMADGKTLSGVRVEADSTQRLWRFNSYGFNPRIILKGIEPVGYHAWVGPRSVALFVLGAPPTLQLADTRTGKAEVIAENIGRSLHKVPGRDAISFVQLESESAWIKEVNLPTRQVRRLIRLLEGNEFYAWTPERHVIMGQGSRLYRWRPGTDASWQEIADFTAAGIRDISRVAVSPDGKYVAIVGVRR